jgi:penicillin-binding protein 2
VPREFGVEARIGRARDLWILIGLLLVLLIARLAYLQLFKGAYFRSLSEENRIRGEILRADRGRVLDRNGFVLADNYPSYRVTFDPRDRAFRENPALLDPTVTDLARILERDPESLAKDVERNRRLWLAPMLLTRNLSFRQLSQIEERMDHLAGVDVQPESNRRYPAGELACHVLGYLGEISEDELNSGQDQGYRMGDLVGRAGIEKQYESVLRGVDGVLYAEVDALGRRTHMFPELPARPAVAGHDLVLTLDANLQRAAEVALDMLPPYGQPYPKEPPPEVSDSSATGPPASLVALDPRTGEVLALASKPGFDPNIFVRGLSPDDWKSLNAPTHPLLNRAIQSAYPPGSVFKLVTSLAGLETGVLTPTRTFGPCRGGFFYGNRVFRCWKPEGHGSLALSDALCRSCDIFYYQLGIALGVERLGRFGERVRIARKTGIDLPQERAGLVPTPEWYRARYGQGGFGPGAALNIAIGQGEVLLTPIEIARFVGAISVGGRVMRPHLLRRIQDLGGRVLRDGSSESWDDGTLGVSQQSLAVLVPAMERVVMDNAGTGTRARVGTFRIAGKTGTAQNPHGHDHAVFACFATVDDPRIAIAVIAEECGHGGTYSAPVAQRVLQCFLTGMSPESVWAASSYGTGEGD